VNDPPPAKAVVGEMEIKDGVGAVMLKPREFEVTPPGACTATEADPGVESKLEGTVALNCVADPKVVLSADPFHRTVSPLTKLLPVTVNAKVVPPATAVAGEMEIKDGVGAVMLKPREFEVAPPGACTVTEADPGVVIKLAGTAEFNCVADTKVVLSAEPFQRTASPLTKLPPFTVSENAEVPATTVVGEIEAKEGTGGGGAETTKVTATACGEP